MVSLLSTTKMLCCTNEHYRWNILSIWSKEYIIDKLIIAVQEERGPRKPKMLNISRAEPCLFVKQNYFPFSLGKDSNSIYETAAHIFLTAIRSARRNPGFGILNRNSQNTILGKFCFHFFKSHFSLLQNAIFIFFLAHPSRK